MKLGEARPGDFLISDVPYTDMRSVNWELYVGRFELTAEDLAEGKVTLPEDAPEWLKKYRGGLGMTPGKMGLTRGDAYHLTVTTPGSYHFTVEASGPIHRKPSGFYLKLWENGRLLHQVDPVHQLWGAETRHLHQLEETERKLTGVKFVIVQDVEVSVVGSRRDTSIQSIGDDRLAYNEHFEVVSKKDNRERRWVMRGLESGEEVNVQVRYIRADRHDIYLNKHRVDLVEAQTQGPREALRSALGRLDDTVDPRAIRVTGETVTMPWATVKALLTNPEAGEAVQALMESALFVQDAAEETGVGPRLVNVDL